MLELRSRILLLLPAPRFAHEFVMLDTVLTDLIKACGGVTATSRQPSAIEGWWWAPDSGKPVQDANMLIFGDVLAPHDDPALTEYLEKLKRRCEHSFRQDLVWMTVHPVHRVTTGDPAR
jgi:hypothetical protein